MAQVKNEPPAIENSWLGTVGSISQMMQEVHERTRCRALATLPRPSPSGVDCSASQTWFVTGNLSVVPSSAAYVASISIWTGALGTAPTAERSVQDSRVYYAMHWHINHHVGASNNVS